MHMYICTYVYIYVCLCLNIYIYTCVIMDRIPMIVLNEYRQLSRFAGTPPRNPPIIISNFQHGHCWCCMSPTVPFATTPLCCAQAISTRPLLVMYVATGQQLPYAALKKFPTEAADQRWSGTTLSTPCNKDLNCAPIR